MQFKKIWSLAYDGLFHNFLAKILATTPILWMSSITISLRQWMDLEKGVPDFLLVILIVSSLILGGVFTAASFIEKTNEKFWGEKFYHQVTGPFFKVLDSLLFYPLAKTIGKMENDLIKNISLYFLKHHKTFLNLTNIPPSQNIGGMIISIEKSYDKNKELRIFIKERKNGNTIFVLNLKTETGLINTSPSVKILIENQALYNGIDRKTSKILFEQIKSYFDFILNNHKSEIDQRIGSLIGVHHLDYDKNTQNIKMKLQLQEVEKIISKLKNIQHNNAAESLQKAFDKLAVFTGHKQLKEEDETALFIELLPQLNEIIKLVHTSKRFEKFDRKYDLNDIFKKTLDQIEELINYITQEEVTEKINNWKNKIEIHDLLNSKVTA